MRAFIWGFFIFLLDSLILIAIVEFGFNRRDLLSESKPEGFEGQKSLSRWGLFVALISMKVFFLLGAVYWFATFYEGAILSLCAGAFVAFASVVVIALYFDKRRHKIWRTR